MNGVMNMPANPAMNVGSMIPLPDEIRELKTALKQLPKAPRVDKKYDISRANNRGTVGGVGPPPEGHERQCHREIKFKGRRCRRWALKGSIFCQFHGGRRSKRVAFLFNNMNGVGPRNRMPGFYSKYLGKTLTKAFEEAMAQGPSEALAVYEELALIRSGSTQAVALYGMACDLSDDNPKKAEIVAAASLQMRDALQEVVKTCAVAAQIEAAQKDKISLGAIKHLVEQFIVVAYDVFGDEHLDLAKLFEFEVRNRIRLPGVGTTSLATQKDMLAELLATVESDRSGRVIDAKFIERHIDPGNNGNGNGKH